MIRPFLPSQFYIGPVTLHLYGLIIGLSIFIIYVGLNRWKKNKLKETDYILIALSALVGARLLHVISQYDNYSDDLTIILKIWDGGLSIFGAIIFCSLTLYILSKKRGLSITAIFDRLFLYIPLAQSLGRWANFFNEELYGKPLDKWYALYIPIEKRISGYEQYESFHPVFFYESILNLVNWAILLLIYRSKKYQTGYITSVYLVNYGLIRLLMNRFRIDKSLVTIIGLEASDFISIITVLFGTVIFIHYYRKNYQKKSIS